jgi:hypothetical protein
MFAEEITFMFVKSIKEMFQKREVNRYFQQSQIFFSRLCNQLIIILASSF